MSRTRLAIVLCLAVLAGLGTMRFASSWMSTEEARLASEREQFAAQLDAEREQLELQLEAERQAHEAALAAERERAAAEQAQAALALAARPPVAAEPASVFVLVADRSLGNGQFLTEEDVRWQAWPRDTLAPTYVTSDTGSIDDYVGAVVRGGLSEGEPVTAARVIHPGERGFLAAVLGAGMRAVSVPISAATSVAGLVFPGDRVDVLLNHNVERDRGPNGGTVRISETVLRDVRVLAIDQNTDNQSLEPQVGSTATLELTPQQVEGIQVVLQLGTLSLSLRSVAEPDRLLDPVQLAAADKASAVVGAEDEDEAVAPGGLGHGQTLTLDTDVSLFLDGMAVDRSPVRPAAAPREVRVVRGRRGGEE